MYRLYSFGTDFEEAGVKRDKMRLNLISLCLPLLLSISVRAQTDQEAYKILDRFSSNALGAPSVSMKFRLITEDQAEDTKDTLKGSIILSKDKYNLELPDNLIWFNGETSWSYLPAEKEVTINPLNLIKQSEVLS